jgi:hypothetical protein
MIEDDIIEVEWTPFDPPALPKIRKNERRFTEYKHGRWVKRPVISRLSGYKGQVCRAAFNREVAEEEIRLKAQKCARDANIQPLEIAIPKVYSHKDQNEWDKCRMDMPDVFPETLMAKIAHANNLIKKEIAKEDPDRALIAIMQREITGFQNELGAITWDGMRCFCGDVELRLSDLDKENRRVFVQKC